MVQIKHCYGFVMVFLFKRGGGGYTGGGGYVGGGGYIWSCTTSIFPRQPP